MHEQDYQSYMSFIHVLMPFFSSYGSSSKFQQTLCTRTIQTIRRPSHDEFLLSKTPPLEIPNSTQYPTLAKRATVTSNNIYQRRAFASNLTIIARPLRSERAAVLHLRDSTKLLTNQSNPSIEQTNRIGAGSNATEAARTLAEAI